MSFLTQQIAMHPSLDIALTAFYLGFVAAGGLAIVAAHFVFNTASSSWAAFGCYLVLTIPLFHMTEFILAMLYRPHDATAKSFMLFHSRPFLMAMAFALCEILLRAQLFGYLPWLGYWGPAIPSAWCVISSILATACYGIRAEAMRQCGPNFALEIEYRRRPEHELVRTGLYRYVRHPSYMGWLAYVVAAQLVVGNAVSAVGFGIVTWKFFKDRIEEEESVMRRDEFFGESYDEYCRSTRSGIPWIP